MIPYHCHTCGRTIFFAEKPEILRSRAFCSPWCLANAGTGRRDSNEDRNDLWFWITQTGRTAIYVAKIYDVKPALVYKSIKSRKKAGHADQR